MKDIDTRVRYDKDTKEVRVKMTQDVTPILEFAESRREMNEGRSLAKQEMVHFARVPVATLLRIEKEHGIPAFGRRTAEEDRKLRRLLQTDYKKLLLWPGKKFA